jgi:hypothetical protein
MSSTNIINGESSKLMVIYFKISLHFCKDCGIFCVGEYQVKDDGYVIVNQQPANIPNAGEKRQQSIKTNNDTNDERWHKKKYGKAIINIEAVDLTALGLIGHNKLIGLIGVIGCYKLIGNISLNGLNDLGSLDGIIGLINFGHNGFIGIGFIVGIISLIKLFNHNSLVSLVGRQPQWPCWLHWS